MPRKERHFSLDELEEESSSGTKLYRMVVGEQDDAGAPNVILTRFLPGRVSTPHYHRCDYLELVLEGSQTVGKHEYRAGDGRVVLANQAYGPLVTGPEGAWVLHVFATGDVEAVRPRPHEPDR